MKTNYHREYFRRLTKYCLMQKKLLAVVMVTGVAGFLINFLFPWMIGSLIDNVVSPQPKNGVMPTHNERMNHLILLTALCVFAAFATALIGWARGHYTMKLGNRIVTALRRDLFSHLQQLSLQFYARQRAGGIVWRLMHEVHGVNGLIHAGVILVLLDVANLIIAMSLLIAINYKLALVVFAIMPLYVITFRLFNPHIRRASERTTQHFGRISGNIQEQVSAMPLVKTYAAERRELDRFMNDNEEHYQLVIAQSRVGHAVGAVSEMWIHLSTATILGMGGYFAMGGQLTAGDIIKTLGYAAIFYGPLKRFAELDMVYQNSLASVRRVLRVFAIEPMIKDPVKPVTSTPHFGDIEYDNVHFHYESNTDEATVRLDDDEPEDSPFKNGVKVRAAEKPRPVLAGISFRIEAGERVAFVGPSGGGKTTLGHLLPRLYDPVEGAIRIDGVDLRDYSLHTLRSSIGMVQQDAFIFSGPVRDNILYGRPEATDEDMFAAAKAANAHDFIMSLPHGYDTLLGERGVNLSGGQRQRISIARALLKNPRILILDEATSALDAESEALVQEALERLMKGRTCLIIAHRLSTVRNADRILVLKDGRIVESGTHDELLETPGLYARLVRQQLAVYREPALTAPWRDGEPARIAG